VALMEHRQSGPLFYLEIAIHYYALGRHAMHCHFHPVAGNVIHHAAEMILKFRFVVNYNTDQLRQKFHLTEKSRYWREPIKSLGHELEDRIWPAFKAEYPNLIAPDLRKHDGFIKKLDRWDEIRYPTSVSTSTTLIPTFSGPVSDHILDSMKIPRNERYEIDLPEIDRFFYDVMTVQDIFRNYIDFFLNDYARPMYFETNRYPLP
jgi:hypothetical protein